MEYLSPSFDPATLTVPRLRSILLSHDVAYPASAKKSQLIELFNKQLVPRSRKILAARSRIRRTSKGITDIPSSQEGTINGDEFDRASSMLPPPVPDTPRRKSSKRSSRQTPEETTLEQPVARTARKSATKHPRPSDTETSDAESKRPSARRTRKSEIPSIVKVEAPDEQPVRPVLGKSPFSDENPFQSGSSPPGPNDGRRRSAGTSVDRRKSASRKRKSEGAGAFSRDQPPQRDGVIVPSSKTFQMSVAQLQNTRDQDDPATEVEAGEDFTPEEQLELTNDQAANGSLEVARARKTKRSSKTGGNTLPRSAPWMVMIALFSGYGMWLRRQKIEAGYCGVGRVSDSIAGVQIPEWANVLQPECEPCPQHAYCYEDMDTRCEQDFVLKAHPLSLGGIVPLPPTCEPDGEKARRVKAVADKAVEELRERRAHSECGTLTDEQGKSVYTPEIDEQDLKKHIATKRRKDMSDREFDDLWKGALGEIIISPDRRHRSYFTSTSLARIDFSCGVRRSFRLALARYRIHAAILMLLAYAFFNVRSRIINLRNDSARVPTLVSTTLDRLATQAALYSRGDAPESWISIGQLRDDVLRDEFSAKRRESLWRRVRAVVEMNTNVRASERELRAGDVSRVWEWIGNLGLLDESWAEGGRRSNVRFSLNERRRDSSTPDQSAGMALADGQVHHEMVEKRHWDEGRPIY
ncbi:MAG: hypothetical protein Q9220_007460 [cf. Caloplaca sp. 1 TL-2023]